MAGLHDVDETTPGGSESPTLGDNELRNLKSKIKEFADIEHNLDGAHEILTGSFTQRPAAGHPGRPFILTVAGVAEEIQYDTGSAWKTITRNQIIDEGTDDLAIHKAATTIDHPDGSVKENKIAVGNIKRKHLDGSTSNASIAALVNGSSADTLHNHAALGVADGSITEAKLADSAVSGNKIKKSIASSGAVGLTSLTTWVIPIGVYNMITTGAVVSLQLNVSGTWYTSIANFAGFVISDGINVRLYNASLDTANIYYHKF